jgi:DNA-binding MarR family transcriptional regulator
MAKSRSSEHELLPSEEWQSWNALLMLSRTVLQALDTELRSAHGLAVTEFDVLITLFNAPDHRLGMSALAEQVLLSPAGATHLVTRLERDGWVRRVVDPSDRRKSYAVLTVAGDRTLRDARHTHNQVLQRTLFKVLSSTDRRMLQKLWQRLSAGGSAPV